MSDQELISESAPDLVSNLIHGPTPRDCKKCSLSGGKAVPGFGPKKPKLMVISDYPGENEVEQGKPMVGQAGILLRNALKGLVGLDPEQDVYYTNVIRCKAEKTPTRDQLGACSRWTTEEFRLVECSIILLAGKIAFETVLPHVIAQAKEEDDDFNVGRAHGQVYHHAGKLYMVTWNPAFVAQYKFKDPKSGIRVGTNKDRSPKMEYRDWYPTGSIPWLFKKDMTKLKALLAEHAGA